MRLVDCRRLRDPVRGTVTDSAAQRSVQQASNQTSRLVDILRSIHRDLSTVAHAPICFFGVYDSGAQSVDVVWQVENGVELPGGAFPLGRGLTSQVIRERQGRLVQDWSHKGPRVHVQYATERSDLPQSAITVPAVLGDRVLGVFSVQSHQSAAFESEHLELVQGLVDRAAADLADLLDADGQAAPVAPPALRLENLVKRAPDAALGIDREGRLVSMNQAARTLLSCDQHSVVFGFPIDRPQAGKWPLGSATLTAALAPLLDRLQRGEAQPESDIPLHADARTVLKCRASTVVENGTPYGAIMTFCNADTDSA